MSNLLTSKGGFFSSDSFFNFIAVVLFLVAYCSQPLLVDIIKLHGGAHSSTFWFLIPHYYSMIMVGFLPTEKKLSECDWRKGILVSTLDIINQMLKKAGLVYAGAAVYIVVDSSSIVWTAVWSSMLLNRRLNFLQWISVMLISGGIALKALQMRLSFEDDECWGVVLILLASVLMGLTFVLNEKFMKGSEKIEGPNLVCMMGFCCAVPVTIWTLFWTAPQFDALIRQPISRSQGSVSVVIQCFSWLFISGCVHSSVLWYLMSHFGAVSTGILKGLKVALVFLLSHYLFCERQPNQCLNIITGTSAIICVAGVILYSFATASFSSGRGDSEDLFCSVKKSARERQEILVSQESAMLSPTRGTNFFGKTIISPTKLSKRP